MRIAKTSRKPLSKPVGQIRIPTETKSYKAVRFPRNLSDLEMGQMATQLVAAAEFFSKKERKVKRSSKRCHWRKPGDTLWAHLHFCKQNWPPDVSTKFQTQLQFWKTAPVFLAIFKIQDCLKENVCATDFHIYHKLIMRDHPEQTRTWFPIWTHKLTLKGFPEYEGDLYLCRVWIRRLAYQKKKKKVWNLYLSIISASSRKPIE